MTLLTRTKFSFLNFLKRTYIYLVLLLIYIPMIIIIIVSFNGQTNKGNINLNFGVPTIVNYVQLFKDSDFLNALFNSVLLAVCVAPISVFIAVITCFGIWNNKNIKAKAVMGITKVSIVNPDIITGISLSLLFISSFLPIGINLGFFTVLLAHISFCVPYAIIAIYPRMQKMKVNLINASYDLGYSRISTFFHVILKYLMPSIISALIIVVSLSFDDFVITNLVNGSFSTISTEIYSARKGIKAWVVTFGAITIMITFLVVLISIFIKRKDKK